MTDLVPGFVAKFNGNIRMYLGEECWLGEGGIQRLILATMIFQGVIVNSRLLDQAVEL